MFRRSKFIVLTAVALYAIALSVAWHVLSDKAEARVRTMLESAETGFAAVINGEIEAALRNVGGALVNVFGGACAPHPVERMQELANTFNLDEINIVDRSGRTIASNVRSVLGFDFNRNPLTCEFMALTNATTSMVSQPFRPGVANPEMTCQYYGIAFPGHDGFLQLGMSVKRLRQNMYSYSPDEAEQILKDWHFSVVGWYERAESDPAYRPGKMIRRWSDICGEMAVGRYFDYKDYRYLALLPVSYCYVQRNSAFVMTALVLAVLLAFFTFILVRLAKASAKLEKMHAAADARTAADLALARTIQMSALPSANGAFLENLEFSLSAECCPAREVGGDFYDFFPLPGGRLAFLVADVSGKGIPGALFMMETKNVLKTCLTTSADIAEAVTEANRRLCENNRAQLFVTAWIGVTDRTGTFEYVNAGHNRPLLRRASGAIEKVMGKGGRFLGLFDDATYCTHALRLEKGDALLLYTDGVTEAMNERGEQFGERRLRDELASGCHRLREALTEFVGTAEQSDDLTGMLIRWHGESESAEKTFPCTEDSLGAAVGFVRSALAGTDGKTVAAILNVTDEIASNIVNYSGAQDYTVTVERGADRLRLRFSDAGRPYNPLSHVDPDTHADLQDRPVGGLGLVVVKRLADRVTYAREGDRNVLTVIRSCGAGYRSPLR